MRELEIFSNLPIQERTEEEQLVLKKFAGDILFLYKFKKEWNEVVQLVRGNK